MPYSIGLIGCGGIAGTWIDAVAATPHCQITMAYDLNLAAAERRAEQVGARAVTEIDALLGNPAIDVVIIGTPTFTHPELVVAAARAGKHILCEKPMALNLAECRRMISACRDGGVKLAIGHSLRFWGAFRKVGELVAADLIGEPFIGQIHRMWPGKPISADAPIPSGKADHWRVETRYSGGNILEGFIHELDFSRTIFGEVTSVYFEATGKERYGDFLSPMVLQGFIGYAAGKTATLRMGSLIAMPCNGLWIGGTQGALAFDSWDGPIRHYRPDTEAPDTISCHNTLAYALELRDLIQAIETDGTPDNSGENGLKNVGLCMAMYRSLAEGVRYEFDNGLPVGVAEDYQYSGPTSIR